MKRNSNPFSVFIHMIYYVFLVILIGFLILPHTSLVYRNKVHLPFSLHLNKDNLILVKGETFKLYVIGINKRVTYSSSDFKVCNVRYNGKLYANRVGTAYIKAKVDGKVLKCRVKVIDMNKDRLSLKVGDTSYLKVIGTNKKVTWKSSKKEVAVINKSGKIIAKSKGTTKITAIVKGKKVYCNVRVK